MRLFKKKSTPTQDNFDDFPPIGGLMVSKMVADENRKPRFMYRQKRSRPEDSGWRIFSGFESEEYTDDARNIGIYNPSTILKIDPSIAGLLLKGVGSVYERNERDEWYKVTDFQMEGDFMVTHRLTEEWIIDINNLFERHKKEDEDLLYTTGDKSVWLAVWNANNRSREDIYAECKWIMDNRAPGMPAILQVFELSDHEIARPGYRTRESDDNKSYNVIHAYSIADNRFIQSGLYFDNDEDISWALDTWKSIRLRT